MVQQLFINNMRIVHITGYYPPHLGGMELRTKELAEHFARKGHKVEVITSDIDCNRNKLPSTKNLRIRYLRSVEFAHTPIMFSLVWQLIKLPKDSIIHLHISQALFPELTYLICKLRNIPYLAHIHLDVEASGFFGRFLPIYKKLFLTPVLRSAKAITVLTKDYEYIIKKKYGISSDKIFIIPNGTYFKVNRYHKKALHKPVRILFVGRLTVQKNVPLLLNALALCIQKKKLAIRLSLAGEGEKKEELLKLITKLKLDNYVHFLGNIPFKKLQRYYTESDIFVLPSTSESFGSVVIEAMASGIPVIASDIQAIKNIIKDKKNGILVSQNADSFADTIENLINDSKLRENIRKAALIDVSKFSWETVTKQYEKVYRSVLYSIKI